MRTRRCSLSDEYTFSWRKLSVFRLCLKRDGNGHTPGVSFLSGMNGLSLSSEVLFNHACQFQAGIIRAENGGGCKVFWGGSKAGLSRVWA